MFRSRFMPCQECGASIDLNEPGSHACDPDRLVDFHLLALRRDLARLEAGITAFLESPAGRFEVWRAARHVRRSIP